MKLQLTFCLTIAAVASSSSSRSLITPTKMLVDLTEAQAEPLMLVTSSATPSFSFVAPGQSPGKHTMTHYQILVRDSAGTTAWDSGKVASPTGHVAGVTCGKTLKSGASYEWTAQYWAAPVGEEEQELASPTSTSRFDVGLLSESDWAGAEWLGGGQKQFKLAPPASALNVLRAGVAGAKLKLHVAAPGGAVVEVGGQPIGDPVGVSLWTENDKSVQYCSYDVTAALLSSDPTSADVVVTAGGGFFTSQDPASRSTNGAATTACRILLVLDTGATGQGDRTVLHSTSSSTAAAAIQGRVGPVVSDDPWGGCTLNTSLGASEGWGAAKAADREDTPQGQLFPLPAPYASRRGEIKALKVEKLGSHRPGAFLYTFPANIVGHASVAAGAASGTGRLVLQHCEVWNHTAGGCIPYDIPPYKYPLPVCGLNHDGTPDGGSGKAGCDTYLLGGAAAALAPKFTWHGFQYVVVDPGTSGDVQFSGALDALTAHWTTADLTETATISFAGGQGAEMLGAINGIVKASQIANMAGFMPTDCPTREKHGWLGDSQITAEEAMYNLWTPGIYGRFLSQIRDSQLTTGENKGFVAGVVPGHTSATTPTFGARSSGLDISWTAAYPLNAGWLLRYYGDTASVMEHWPSLKLYVDGQLRVAASPAYANSTSPGLPDYYTWGDWCAAESRADATPGTGPQLAAANFLMSLLSMVEIATAVGDSASATKYHSTYARLVPEFQRRFWNGTMGTWASDPLEVQTLTAVTLGAGVGNAVGKDFVGKAVAALDKDIVSRGYHLTVGSAGQKWLLRTLSKEGKHDTALKLAMQTSYPSWGYWLDNGATSCWESWSGVADPSHPPHPTHNHIFLCGGVGEWFYEYMAGIIPTSSGYATVDIKPQVSKTIGPSSVNAAVNTVRGTVLSNWTRHITATPPGGAPPGTKMLSMHVQIPSGILAAVVRVPLLGLKASEAQLQMRSNTLTQQGELTTVWKRGTVTLASKLLGPCKAVVAADGDEVLELSVGAGMFEFGVMA